MVVSKKSTISSVSLFPVVSKKKLAISCSFFCSLCLLSMKHYSKDTEARPGPSKRRCVSHSTFKKNGKMSWTKSFRLCLGLIVRCLGPK